MLYLLDTANVKEIEDHIENYPVSGVTTNPSLLAREGESLCSLAKGIRRVIGPGRMLHLQTMCDDFERIVREGLSLQKLVGGAFYVKVPVDKAGIKAIMLLKKAGVGVTATSIFTQQQALVAARAGADFVAPYVNRLDNISGGGVAVVSDIAELFKMHGISTRILAASFKNVEQVHRVSMAGAHCATLAPELLERLIYHPLTDISIDEFKRTGIKCPQAPFGQEDECAAGELPGAPPGS